MNLFGDISDFPLLFEEQIEWKGFLHNFLKKANSEELNKRAVPLFVFVHGYKGSSYDLRLIRNNLMLIFPSAYFLLSTSNEKTTEIDITKMGENLALEVIDFIKENSNNNIKSINLLGHSLGGIIIRAALPFLVDYKYKMQTLVTFSTPHLGLMFSQSSLTNLGVWFFQKWNNAISLKQLSMEDSNEKRYTLLYNMADYMGIEWFENIVLVGSSQDSYCPFESGRIDMCLAAVNDNIKGPSYIEMIRKLKAKITGKNIFRVDVNFKIIKT